MVCMKENGGAHRCVIASITVKAPIREVWNVLTTYEALPEYSFSSLCFFLLLWKSSTSIIRTLEVCLFFLICWHQLMHMSTTI